jgi:hypothetical protein
MSQLAQKLTLTLIRAESVRHTTTDIETDLKGTVRERCRTAQKENARGERAFS